MGLEVQGATGSSSEGQGTWQAPCKAWGGTDYRSVNESSIYFGTWGHGE
jgi:hypothetical protein